MQLTGVHHLTAISARIADNLRFYTGVLGMRLVKRSVNQDDVSAYHLFYADGAGSPGTDLTFFDWPVRPEGRGTSSIVRTHLRVGRESLEWWSERLREHGVADDPGERGGQAVVDFEDGEGQRLSLIEDGGLGDPPVIWEESPVPGRHQIRGLGPIVISVPSLSETDRILTRVMGLRPVLEYTDSTPWRPKRACVRDGEGRSPRRAPRGRAARSAGGTPGGGGRTPGRVPHAYRG